MSHILAPLALALAVVCIAWGTWPTRRYNRRVKLSAPDPRCRRTDPMNDTPTRSIP